MAEARCRFISIVILWLQHDICPRSSAKPAMIAHNADVPGIFYLDS